MTVERGYWHVQLGALAKADLRNIIEWTHEQFGEKQSLVYADMIAATLEMLSDGPTRVGVKERVGVAKGSFTFPVARGRRRGRHFLLFRVSGKPGARSIEVLRLLHNAMDLERYIPSHEAPAD